MAKANRSEAEIITGIINGASESGHFSHTDQSFLKKLGETILNVAPKLEKARVDLKDGHLENIGSQLAQQIAEDPNRENITVNIKT